MKAIWERLEIIIVRVVEVLDGRGKSLCEYRGSSRRKNAH
jgi:hypothetical protein